MDFIEAPTQSREQTIRELREISRKLVRELGFMRNTLAESDLAPSAVHAVLEIAGAPGIQARDLAQRLRLDKSSTSRQVTRLESAGLVERRTCTADARSSELHLTQHGQQLRRKIDAFASDQVSNALRHLTPADQQRLVASLSQYVSALADDNDHKPPQNPAPADTGPQIVQGYVPGCIGDIASLHGRFYAQHWGFGVFSSAASPRNWPTLRNPCPTPTGRSGCAWRTTAASHRSPLTATPTRASHTCAGSSWMIHCVAPALAASSCRKPCSLLTRALMKPI